MNCETSGFILKFDDFRVKGLSQKYLYSIVLLIPKQLWFDYRKKGT